MLGPANAVVVKDVPENATMVGILQKRLENKGSLDLTVLMIKLKMVIKIGIQI